VARDPGPIVQTDIGEKALVAPNQGPRRQYLPEIHANRCPNPQTARGDASTHSNPDLPQVDGPTVRPPQMHRNE